MTYICFEILHGRYRISHVPGAILIFDMKPKVNGIKGAPPFASILADGEDVSAAAKKALDWLLEQKRIDASQYDDALSEAKKFCADVQ